MTTLVFDGSWTALLCCVYEIYEKKLQLVTVVPQSRFQPDVFSQSVKIAPNEVHAKRVWAGLAKRISKQALGKLYNCYLSELTNIENTLCSYMRLAFDTEQSPEHAYANPIVLKVSKVDKMVHREKHRMEAFIRFQLLRDELYYASIEPDFNLLPLIAPHFKRRYADQRWLIYDLKRNYGIYYNLEAVEEVTLHQQACPRLQQEILHSNEMLYQQLWADYFKHVNITERKNTKLHLMHVPKRYWKHLTEKII